MNITPSVTDMLRGLIAAPSISSADPALDMSNRAVVELLATWLEPLGFNARVLEIAGFPGKYNLIATLGEGAGGLILAGHTDTVPYDANRWRHDPFKLTEDDRRFYGLGTADMKGFFALAIDAARQFNAREFTRPLILLATADEETSMSGARALIRSDVDRGRYAVIGEPTSLKPVRQHKGILMEAIRLIGQSGHSSDPRLGNSALEGMHEVMSALLEYRAELQARYRNDAFTVPVPTLNLGHIHGGDNPNRICGACELHLDLRHLPGMTIDQVRQGIRERASHVAARRHLEVEFEALFPGIEAFKTEAGSAIIQTAEALTGHRSSAVGFGTEGPFLNQYGIDTLILGPGNIDQAHQPDEYLTLESIPTMTGMLQQLIHRFCVAPPAER
ncbi:MAG: acetylornithine deacetylase [Thiotrichales bacterium]